MPKDKFKNPLDDLMKVSPYVRTETPEQAPDQTPVEMPVNTSTVTDTDTSVQEPAQTPAHIPTPVETHSDANMPIQTSLDMHTNVPAPTPDESPTHTYAYVEDEWSNLPSDVVSKRATERASMFEQTHDTISSWIDKKLKKGMYTYFKIGRRGGRKVTHVLNEAVRDILRKYQYLLPLSQELKRPIDDLLVEAMHDLVEKYKKKD